jgi:hypothetical protein
MLSHQKGSLSLRSGGNGAQAGVRRLEQSRYAINEGQECNLHGFIEFLYKLVSSNSF